MFVCDIYLWFHLDLCKAVVSLKKALYKLNLLPLLLPCDSSDLHLKWDEVKVLYIYINQFNLIALQDCHKIHLGKITQFSSLYCMYLLPLP